MPELPEVETVARDLRPLLVGRSLTGIRRSGKALRQPWKKRWETQLLGRRVEAVGRRGKWLLVELDSGACLVVHLGMTGQFFVTPRAAPTAEHTHIVLALDNANELRFCDVRRFGSVTLFPDRPSWESHLAERLGPEPWAMTNSEWRAALGRTGRSLKAVLLDQTIVAGVGNIYADESCFAARISPRRRGRRVRPDEAHRLLLAMRRVLDRAIAARGSTIRDYVGGSGLRGGYQERFAVYGRTGQPCPRCGAAIRCLRLAGRSTHYCGRCQR